MLLLFVVVVAVALLFSSLALFAAVVVLVPSFFGDDAPFAEDILRKERSPFEFSLVASSEKKTSALLLCLRGSLSLRGSLKNKTL